MPATRLSNRNDGVDLETSTFNGNQLVDVNGTHAWVAPAQQSAKSKTGTDTIKKSAQILLLRDRRDAARAVDAALLLLTCLHAEARKLSN